MKIGIIGLGVVGTAVKNGMVHVGHTVAEHDLKLKTSITDLLDCEIVFICVPTPTSSSGRCNTKILESVVDDLVHLNYQGIIAVKSTVSIGTTERLSNFYKNSKICFVPEFLRERCATEDFIYNHDLCAIGALEQEVYEKVKQAHGDLPEKVVFCTPSEAEAVKYFNNIYNAVLITFANSYHDICEHMGVDYSKVKELAVLREHINDIYLNSSQNLKGFSGPCLPKDTKEIAALSVEESLNHITFFSDVLKQNSVFKKTVLDGMRDE